MTRRPLRALLPAACALLTWSTPAQSLPTPYAWYRGEGNAQDAVGTNHGTPLNGVSYAPGRTGQAFLFDGQDDSVSLPTSALPPGDFSVEVWCKMNALTSFAPCNAAGCDQLIFGNQADVNGPGWRLLKQANNQIWVLVNGGGPNVATSGTFAANTWIHVVATFTNWGQAGSTVTLYVDGALVGSAAVYGTHNDVKFGGSPTGTQNNNGMFNGLIDEVKIYGVALSPAQVTAAFQNTGSVPGVGPRDVELLDLDGDGDLDVATANEGSDNVSLRSNNGSGVLGTDTTVSLTASDHAPVALVRCDLDNDGSRDDLAVVCVDSSTLVRITNPGSSPVVTSSPVAGLRPSCVAAGDLDGNPIDDLVLGREGEPLAGGGGLALVLNGGAAVSLPIPAPHPTQVVKVALGDLDGDGDLDLAALALGSSDELLLFAGDGAGAFTFAGALPVATSGLANGLCVTDLDRDGRNDLVVAQPQLFPPTQTLRIWRRTSSGALAPALFVAGSDVSTPGSFALDLQSGDLDDASIPGFLARVDLVVANAGSGTVTIQHGFTGSGFSSISSPSVGTNPVAVAVGDLNGDGCADVVVANQGSDDVTVLLTTPPALAQTYGNGCGGPTIAAVGAPTLGNAAFAVRVSNARPVAPVLMLFSPGAQDTPLLPGSCHLLLANPILQLFGFTNSSGQMTRTFGIPNTPSLSGADVFFQGAVFHSPGGAFADTLDFSDALRVQVGQ